MKTIKNYQSQAEQAFGALRFQIGARNNGNTGGEQPKYALLTEDQAIFLMTLSQWELSLSTVRTDTPS